MILCCKIMTQNNSIIYKKLLAADMKIMQDCFLCNLPCIFMECLLCNWITLNEMTLLYYHANMSFQKFPKIFGNSCNEQTSESWLNQEMECSKDSSSKWIYATSFPQWNIFEKTITFIYYRKYWSFC